MIETPRISSQQLLCLAAVFQYAATLLYIPALLTKMAGTGAWLAIPGGLITGALPPALLLGGLARYHPERSLGEIATACLGRWGGKLISLLLGGFSLFLASLVVRNIMDFSVVALLRDTPITVIGALFTVLAVYAAYNGAEVVARLAVLSLLVTLMAMMVLGVGLGTELRVLQLLPLLGHGVMPILQATWQLAGWFGEIWVFGPLIGAVDRPPRVLRSLWWGATVAAAMLTVMAIFGLLVFGADLIQKFVFPPYTLVQMMTLGEFLERLEVALVMTWLGTMCVKSATCIWSATRSLAHVLGVQNHRKLLLPVGAATLALTLVWPSIIVLIVWALRYWTLLTLPLAIGIPALLVLISWWQARRRRRLAA